VAGQLRDAEERGHAADGGQPDRGQVTRRVGVRGRGVLEGQHDEHDGRGRDAGDDPEQRPPGAGVGLQAADERPERDGAEDAHVHDHGGVAQLVLREADGQRRDRGDQQQARAQPLDDVPGDEHAGVLGRRLDDRAGEQQHRVAEQHPALREVLGEHHGEHGADGVGGVAQSGAQAQRLGAHVELLHDDRRQRLQRRGERQVRDQREHHHRRDRDVAAGERALAHQRSPVGVVITTQGL
jgi:hypothetical protein